MIKNPLNPGILFKKCFGKLLMSLVLLAVLLISQSGMAFASGSDSEGLVIAQQRVITGIVTETDGSPMPGVAVQEKGRPMEH